MSLPSAYLTSFRHTEAILQAIQAAQAPPRFTQKFLEGLGFANTNDRTIINVLKSIGFLDESGVPTARYHRYLDQTQSALVLAEGLRDAYEDLFRINRKANEMSANDIKNKMKTLSEGAYTDRVLTQMAGTFTTLARIADFSGVEAATAPRPASPTEASTAPTATVHDDHSVDGATHGTPTGVRVEEPLRPAPFTSLAYHINIQLPESRDPAVYNAIFKALRDHLQ